LIYFPLASLGISLDCGPLKGGPGRNQAKICQFAKPARGNPQTSKLRRISGLRAYRKSHFTREFRTADTPKKREKRPQTSKLWRINGLRGIPEIWSYGQMSDQARHTVTSATRARDTLLIGALLAEATSAEAARTAPCDSCGETPPVLHTPIRAAGWYCATCCPQLFAAGADRARYP
jgi:hypothetical protein